jgi:hypothetical protein
MDDDWELGYFGNLAQQGQGDFDGDRLFNLFEFRSATDPTDPSSNIRIEHLSTFKRYIGGIFAQETSVSWLAAPGRTYRLQFKTNLTGLTWYNVTNDITAGGVIASKVHSVPETFTIPFQPPTAHRFYRVLMLP